MKTLEFRSVKVNEKLQTFWDLFHISKAFMLNIPVA